MRSPDFRRTAFTDWMDEIENICPACGDSMDYCQGHGVIGDPVGSHVLYCHYELDKHDKCHQLSDCEV